MVFLILLGSIQACLGYSGQLDNSFGKNGTVLSIFNDQLANNLDALVIQKDGRVVAIGYSGAYPTLARYHINGTLDTSFNGKGWITTKLGPDYASSVATAGTLQDDGKVIAVGYAINNTVNYLTAARYNLDGTLDTSFNANSTPPGILIIKPSTNSSLSAHGVIVQKDTKIVISGNTEESFYLTRLNNNGSFDSSFNGNGTAILNFGGMYSTFVTHVALQHNDKIVIAGNVIVNESPKIHFAIVQYNENGSLDNSFGTNGIVADTFYTEYSQIYGIVIQEDGKIIVAGSDGLIPNFALARYNPDGTIDKSFGQDPQRPGIVITSFDGIDSQAFAIVIQKDGKIVVCGRAGLDFALARYLTNGTLDETFNPYGSKPGLIITKIYPVEASTINSAALQKDGKIIVGGYARAADSEYMSFTLARYLN